MAMVNRQTLRSRGHKEREEIEVALVEGPQFEKVKWTREPHLRKLYAWAVILTLGSITTGYDGMLVNTSQQIDRWKSYFPQTQVGPNNPQAVADSWLGLLVNIFNIGSVISFFITLVSCYLTFFFF